MELGIEGRVALVLGASKGIGRGIAASLAREGARVAICSRSEESLAAAVRELEGEVRAFAGDTTDLERMRALPVEVAEALGPVEILVLNTGGPPAGGALDTSLEHWDAAFRSLVLAPVVLVGTIVPGMRERGWGRILNVGSSSTVEPRPELMLSNSNRLAALGFLKTLATEVAPDGITVNTIATGMIATDRLAEIYGSMERAQEVAREKVPLGRLGTPEEYGDVAAFLCSERAGFLTGSVIRLDGGMLRAL